MTRGQGPRPGPGAAAGHHTAAEIGRLAGVESTRRRKDPGVGGDAARARDTGRELRIEVRGGSPVSVRVVGDLDLRTAPALRDRIQELGPVDVIVECDELHFVDSTGVSLLVRMHHDLRSRGRTLRLRGVAGVPRRTLEILGLTETLGLVDG